MPENIHDTPARIEENEEYLRDPLSPSAKPYSTKQIEANHEHASRVWLYHKDKGGHLFYRDEADDAIKDGWKSEPYVHPNNPKHQVEEVPVESSELDMLREEAEEMGIKIDKRWNIKRLKEEMLNNG